MNIKKNDVIEVICGEEKGKRGKILKILKSKEYGYRLLIDGLNLAKKHQRTRGADKPGGIIDLPNPVHISNTALICPKCGKRTKIRHDKVEGRRIRICRLCEEVID
ncbi:MAG: 50S ribosomal protein L24 [candidate division WOR-3 bacterium]|nr:50S ribosomal protein L24 [candidate division WOR-3 bacterium]MDH5683527.1 50S ribosomal protein L24 [candidate division WOR-3 bacterium]